MPRRDVLLTLLVVVIWGVNFVVVDIGLETFPPFLLVALRYLVVLPAAFFVPRPKVKARYVLALGLFIGIGQFGMLFLAMHLGMPPGLSSLVLQCQAIFTVVFGLALLRERPTGHQTAGLLVACAGMIVIGVSQGLRAELAPLLLVVAAGASWGVGNIVARTARADGLPMVVWSSFVPPVPLFALSLTIDGPTAVARSFTHLTWTAVAAVLFLGVLATIVGFGIWASLLRRHQASAVAPFALLVPVVGMLTAWLAVGERTTPTELTGGVLVLLGLAVLNRVFSRRGRRSPDTRLPDCQPEHLA